MQGGDWKEMFYGCENNDIDLVRYHIRMGVDPNYQHPEFMTTALIECIRLGHLGIAEFLLDNGADPELKEVFGAHTPLSMAKWKKNREAIQLVNDYLQKENPAK